MKILPGKILSISRNKQVTFALPLFWTDIYTTTTGILESPPATAPDQNAFKYETDIKFTYIDSDGEDDDGGGLLTRL